MKGSLLLCFTLLYHWGEARVLTEAQAGPLYRVVGSPLSIACHVSGFKSEDSEKQFEFRVAKPANPAFEINIISTEEESFAYAMYARRVSSKDIGVQRVSANSVVFQIQSLQKGDEGEYDCSVVNSEHIYDGAYSVKTTVKVIDDSLSVLSPSPTLLSFNEGETLTVTCQASSSTIQHTHLSLAWLLHKDNQDNPQPIISLDKDFTLNPGQGFEGRYHAGLISLDKLGEATYRLNMAQLEPSDQGKIYCQAQEWIQDPDHSWYPIAQKDAEKITLKVKPREVVPDTSSLTVKILASHTILQEGQELPLSCNIDAQNLEERFFTVAWMRESVELARIGPTGILSVGSEYSGREKEGELRATRTGNRDYRLILQPVRTEDQGEYKCRAWPQDIGTDGVFRQGASQDSSSQLVSISATASGLSVTMQDTVNVTEGDRLRLACKVEGVNSHLSVTWQYQATSTPTSSFINIIGLSQDGVIEEGDEFRSRKVTTTRPATDSFVFELDDVAPSDSGVYQCAVSEWKTNDKTHSQSQNTVVTVTPLVIQVSLISRNSKVTLGEDVDLMCRVKGPRKPMTLTWSVQRDATTPDTILTMYSDGRISWSGQQDRYQVKVENKNNEVIHYLQILGASHREAGSYQCWVSVFLRNVHKKQQKSNQVAVMVQNPESKLALYSMPTMTRNINSDIKMNCSITSKSSPSSLYAVTWVLQQGAENKTIVSSDRTALVAFGPQEQRISSRRTNGPSFELTIRQAKISDKGTYVCTVAEWLQDPRGDWYQLSTVSTTTKLRIMEPVNNLRLDVKKQLLIAKEGDEVEFKCNIVSGASGALFSYKVAWLYTVNSSSPKNTSLVELDQAGLLSYPEDEALRGLQGRLRLSRPTQSSFYLNIQRAHEGDSGAYWCHVEQYQLDHENGWLQKASDSAGPFTLRINFAENNLATVKKEEEFNISLSQDFTIPCHITKQSSNESKFQVSWFWQKTTESKKQRLFTVYQNSTLQDTFEKGVNLRFGHPLPNEFSLTVLKPGPEMNGLYFCEVEEWLPSLAHGWRKVAEESSGKMTINVDTEGKTNAVSHLECNSIPWIVITVVVIIISLFVMLLLILKIWKSKTSEGRKPGASLWAEQLPMKPSEED